MLGFNGGLMGVRRTPTNNAASGLWFQNEQSVAQRADIWPTSGNIAGLNPALWYDFADEATVTTSGTEITAVTSKGSRNWTLTKSTTGPEYVTGINGKKCLDWGSVNHSNFLSNSDSTTTQIGEVYVVVDGAFGGSFGGLRSLMTGTGPGSWYFLGSSMDFSYFEQAGTGFDQAFVNGSTASRAVGQGNRYTYPDPFSPPSIDSPAIIRVNNSTSATFNATDGFQIGKDRTNGNRGWFGLVGEYVVFSSVLNTTDRSTVQNALAAKWGITLV